MARTLRRGVAWARENLFRTWWQSVLTLAGLALVWRIGKPILDWAVFDAAFGTTPESCVGIRGACWSFIADRYPMFLVGTYPGDERWRPLLAFLVLLTIAGAAMIRDVRRHRAFLWLVPVVTVLLLALLKGGEALGLRPVPTEAWGGLMLTVILSSVGIVASFPIGLLLALARRSRKMPAVRAMAVGYIELIRGVPLVSVLFLAAVLVPLFLPGGAEVDSLVRAQIGIVAFQSAYIAEVIRGGLQAVPHGQEEAATALGLSRFQVMHLVVVPQALRMVVPAMVNQFIIIIKDTSLVVVVGMHDLLGIAELSIRGAVWLGKTYEAYAFVGLIYWVACFMISRASLRLEGQFRQSRV
jgi:general L-amino acid transport system permease protein